MRSANILSESAQEFGYRTDSSFGGWQVTSGSASLKRINGIGYYRKYVPEGIAAGYSEYGNMLVVTSTSASAVELTSELFEVNRDTLYNCYSVFSSQYDERVGRIFVDFYDSEDSTTPLADTNTYTERNTTKVLTASAGTASHTIVLSPTDAKFAKMRIRLTDENDTGSITANDKFVLYDPIISSISSYETPQFALRVYESLPDFMLDDDAQITDIIKNPVQPTAPLRKFVESLCSRLSGIAETAKSFEYVRPTEGTESKPVLVDPVNAPVSYLPWLASVTGTTLTSIAAGFTPWLALEALDLDSDAIPGEWEDLELLADWRSLEDVDPDFFDSISVFRNYIRTGFTGINGGKKTTIEEFIRSSLTSEDPDSEVVVLKRKDRDTPFRCELLVGPDGDPDESGSLLANFANDGMPVGVAAVKTNSVERSGDADYEISLLVEYEAGEDAVGVHDFTQGFIYDAAGYGRNLLLNSTDDAKAPDLGGGVGEAHFTFGTSYFSGDETYWTSAETSGVNLTDNDGGYEIFVELGNINPTFAERVDTFYPAGVPAGYYLREKRLIAAGYDLSDPDGNDWALYMVAGTSLSFECGCRLLLVDGYKNVTTTNYALSDVIKLAAKSSTSPLIIRVKKDADNNVTFYAQNSYYGNWEANKYGTTTIVPNSTTAVQPAIQIGGTLNNGLWSDAEQISAAFYRVMVFTSSLNFEEGMSPSGTTKAVVEGQSVYDYEVFDYNPNFFVNFKNLDNYAETTSAVQDATAGITLLEDETSPVLEPSGLFPRIAEGPVSADLVVSERTIAEMASDVYIGTENIPQNDQTAGAGS